MVVKIKKYLRKNASYFTPIGFLLLFIIFTIFIFKLKGYSINKEVDEVLNNSYNVINNDLFEDRLIVGKENQLSEQEKVYDENIIRLKESLMANNKISEAYLMAAYENVIYDQYDDAVENLKKSFENMKKSTSTMTKIYTGTLLAQIYVYNGEEVNACRTVENSLSYIRKKDYNKYYKEIWKLMYTVIDTECGMNTVVTICEEILNNYVELEDEAELYLLMKMKDVYIKNNNYSKVSEYLIKSCYKAYDLQDNYMLAKCATDLGILSRKIENREKAIEIISYALGINIENDYERAYMSVYEKINLAEIYCELERYKEAEICIDSILSDIKIINGNKYTEFEIRRLIVLSEISIYENDIENGKKYLDKAKSIIETNTGIQNKDISINYNLAYGSYLEAKGLLKDAIDNYSGLIKECIEKKDLYNERKSMKRIINITMSNKECVLDEQYIDELAEIINNDDDIVYGDYSHYISESVRSEIIIGRQRERNKFIFKILFLSITFSIAIFIVFFRKLKTLRIQNQKDGLTKAYNRLYFNECYDKSVRSKNDFAVIMIDVDNFKVLNDTYGHQFGDIVLVRICREISQIIDKNMKLCRYGGEEFVILCMDINRQETRKTAESIRQCVEEMKWEEDVKVTLSIGVADSKQGKDNVLKKADKNLYKAKTTGKNKVVG